MAAAAAVYSSRSAVASNAAAAVSAAVSASATSSLSSAASASSSSSSSSAAVDAVRSAAAASAHGLPRNFAHIWHLAQTPARTITLGQLIRSTSADPKALIKQGRWLHNQLPIRFARRINDFVQLPYALVRNEHFRQVLDAYCETFDKVTSFPDIRDERDEARFCEMLTDQLRLHASAARLVSTGYRETRLIYPHVRHDEFLDNLFITRISTRILMENYIAMRNPIYGHIGVIKKEFKPLDVINERGNEITKLAEGLYGCAPRIEVRGNVNCTLDYIPQHVKFMVQELLKNAVRATLERNVSKNGTDRPWKEVPAVDVELQKGDSHVIIKISDQGGGMPRPVQQEVWQYGWTSVNAESDSSSSSRRGRNGSLDPRDLAGYGFGLPLTRLHAQYFGGDVFMQVLPGHGTDMYLLLNHLKEGTASTEEDDPSTALSEAENKSASVNAP
eukprot:TRINITY_DN91464_c0_g1_i1.p1 TRINITY_DN91464_c0_g1~~TRINITY_DN91464_c0_g1_i1.p1  ORF type:complete len:446 (-),score=68.02 TRINITY_DN91464_c0_g1_i1:84-1421(-)